MNESKEYAVCREDVGTIYISEDVISAVAASAMYETEGVRSPKDPKTGEKAVRRAPSKAVRIKVSDGCIYIDCAISVIYGKVIPEVAEEVQKNISKMVESVTGLCVKQVNVNVTSITF